MPPLGVLAAAMTVVLRSCCFESGGRGGRGDGSGALLSVVEYLAEVVVVVVLC